MISKCDYCKLDKIFDENGKWIYCPEILRRLNKSSNWSYCKPSVRENCYDFIKEEK